MKTKSKPPASCNETPCNEPIHMAGCPWGEVEMLRNTIAGLKQELAALKKKHPLPTDEDETEC